MDISKNMKIDINFTDLDLYKLAIKKIAKTILFLSLILKTIFFSSQEKSVSEKFQNPSMNYFTEDLAKSRLLNI